jgi:hypothetical protein
MCPCRLAIAFRSLFGSQHTCYICEHQVLNTQYVESELGSRLGDDHLQLELSRYIYIYKIVTTVQCDCWTVVTILYIITGVTGQDEPS